LKNWNLRFVWDLVLGIWNLIMNRPIISIIAAVAENRAIGLKNKLLWDIPEDMKHFQVITRGHPVIMGQKTFESIGKPLPNRVNIVLTQEPDLKIVGCITVNSIEQALTEAKKHDQEEIFFVGGGTVYKQALPLADKLYLTVVKGNFEADTYFPDYAQFTKVVSRRESHDDNFHYTFLELVRPDAT
jgi:dihydrofolate reductase